MNKKLIRKMLTAAGGPLHLTPEELKYLEWSKMTPEQKREYRTNRAKTHLLSGPNITNFWEAFQTYIGNRDPKNPNLQTGDVPIPEIRNPKDIIQLFRATGTSGKFKPSLDGTPEFTGQWFTDNIRKPLKYASSTFKKAKISKESNPVELQVVEIPASEINKYKASELLKGRIDIEYEPTEDFLIPLDYPRLKYPIEGLTGNLLLDMRLKLPIEKQGGKMNILEFLKNGSGIHIKEKNKGKFTSYCGGKVTDECIRKAKASGNPTLVKRATFADNARHFKHRSGGLILFAEEGTKMNFGLRLGNFLNSDLGKTAINSGLSLFNTYSANNSLEALAQAQKAENELEAANAILRAMEEYLKNRLLKFKLWMSDYLSGKTMDLPSDIVAAHLGYEDFNLLVANIKSGIKLKNTLMDMAVALAKQDNWTTSIGGILLEGLGTLGNYLGKKKETNASAFLPKLTTNTYIPNTTLTPSLGRYSSSLYDVNKFYNL